jgi:hypothetical protein
MNNQTLIYIDVKGYPGKHWLAVQSIKMHENCYKVLEESEDPEHEYWEYTLGDIVRCETNEFAEGEFGLIAVSKCECQD